MGQMKEYLQIIILRHDAMVGIKKNQISIVALSTVLKKGSDGIKKVIFCVSIKILYHSHIFF